jgi:[NiFe] hydrogenase assembly HybE family chaperone
MTEPAALEAAFRRIATTRMAGMPLVNSALEVEAVAFREWEGLRVGVLVTPWAINLVLLPGEGAPLSALALGERRSLHFPSGEYEFMGGAEPECGPFQFCSLFSPPEEFADQSQARAVATEIVEQLLARPAPPAISRRAFLAPPAGA